MSKHPLFAFVDTDPNNLPMPLRKRLARSRTLALYGVTEKETYAAKLTYEANEVVGDDNESVKSTDSDEDAKDGFTMKVRATHENGLRYITVDEEPDSWKETFKGIGHDD